MSKQSQYDKKWIKKNKDHKRYLSYRSSARSFIRNHATNEDLVDLKSLITKREMDIMLKFLEENISEALDSEVVHSQVAEITTVESQHKWYGKTNVFITKYTFEDREVYSVDEEVIPEVVRFDADEDYILNELENAIGESDSVGAFKTYDEAIEYVNKNYSIVKNIKEEI